MRRSLHFVLGALLAVVSITAPFAHTHAAGKAKAHLAHGHFSVLHAHIRLASHGAALSEADESARPVNWYHFQLEQNVALAAPDADPSLRPPSDPSGRLKRNASEPTPEESPPRAISPRGPPILFA